MSHEKERRKAAVALRYDTQRMAEPIVTAKGKGEIAERIIAEAKERDIPIQEDPSLVELLSKLNINESIPDELYRVVAEVFAFVYQVDKQVGKNGEN
jgi:flagellar biosynthesis protein